MLSLEELRTFLRARAEALLNRYSDSPTAKYYEECALQPGLNPVAHSGQASARR